MIKRLLYLLPALLLLATLAACGPEQEAEQEEPPQEEEAPPPPEPAEAPPLEEEPAGEVVEIGSEPEGVVADPETGLVAVALREPAGLVLADGESGEVVSETELPAPARHLSLAGPGGPVLVPSERADTLFQVGLPGGGIESETPVEEFPHNAAAHEGRVFVINEFESTLSVIEDGEVVETLQTPLWPGGVATTDGGLVAVLGVRGLTMEVYDAETLESLGEVEAGEGPTHVAAGPGERLYVADTRGGAVLVYETEPELDRVSSTPLPDDSPYGIALDPERGHLWISLAARNSVIQFALEDDGLREVERYPTVRQPNTVTVNPETGRLYITGREQGELQLLDPE